MKEQKQAEDVVLKYIAERKQGNQLKKRSEKIEGWPFR